MEKVVDEFEKPENLILKSLLKTYNSETSKKK